MDITIQAVWYYTTSPTKSTWSPWNIKTQGNLSWHIHTSLNLVMACSVFSLYLNQCWFDVVFTKIHFLSGGYVYERRLKNAVLNVLYTDKIYRSSVIGYKYLHRFGAAGYCEHYQGLITTEPRCHGRHNPMRDISILIPVPLESLTWI